jgi:S1-C subfamily serine protease
MAQGLRPFILSKLIFVDFASAKIIVGGNCFMRTMKLPWVLCVMGLISLGCAQTTGQHNSRGTIGRATARGPDFVSLVKELQPTVVNVSASIAPPVTVQPGAQRPDDPADGPMEKFFGAPPPPAATPQRQQGSGFIIGSEGIIVTNAHVVAGAKKIVVKLGDKREFEARVIGKDGPTDVALLKIGVSETLPTIQLGDSDKVEVGEWGP